MKTILSKLHAVINKLENDNKTVEAKIVNDVFVKIALEQKDIDELAPIERIQGKGKGGYGFDELEREPFNLNELSAIQSVHPLMGENLIEESKQILRLINSAKDVFGKYDYRKLTDHLRLLTILMEKTQYDGSYEKPGAKAMFAMHIRPIYEDICNIEENVHETTDRLHVQQVCTAVQNILNHILQSQ